MAPAVRLGTLLRGAAVALALAALSVTGAARAQSALGGERGTPLVPGGETTPPGHFTVSLAGTVGDRGGALAPMAFTVGLTRRLEAGMALLDWPGGDPQARGATRDLRLSLRARLWYQTAERPALALGLAADHLARGVDLLPSLSAQKDVGPVLLTAQLGWRTPSRRDAADPAGATYGVGAAWTITPPATALLAATGATGAGQPKLSVMPGFAWSLLGADPMAARRQALQAQGRRARAEAEAAVGAPLSSPAELALPGAGGQGGGAPAWSTSALFAARSPVMPQSGRITFFLTGGPSFGGRETFRAFLGIQVSTFDELLLDSDGDGIPDRFDKCPFEPEDYDGFEDDDGCPDHGGEVLRRLAEERARAVAQAGPRFTSETPRFRLSIHLGVPPAPDSIRRSTAPMYEPPRLPEPPAGSTGGGSGARLAPKPPERAVRPAPRPPATTASTKPVDVRAVVAVVMTPTSLELRPASGDRLSRRAGTRPRDWSPTSAIARVAPGAPLRELDQQVIEQVERAAGEAGDQLLVWARASRPEIQAEAWARANALAADAAAAGRIDRGRIVVRATLFKADAPVIEIAVSAGREGQASIPLRPRPGDAPPLQGDETGLYQVRQVLTIHRADIEACFAAQARRPGDVAHGVMRLAVAPDGRVEALTVAGGALDSTSLQECLARTSGEWRFPASAGGFDGVVPYTVLRRRSR